MLTPKAIESQTPDCFTGDSMNRGRVLLFHAAALGAVADNFGSYWARRGCLEELDPLVKMEGL